jgi:serine/threonine protein kinase
MAVDADDAKTLLETNYHHVEYLGQGAFGVVFRGVQRATGEERAIKVVKTDADVLATVVDAAAAAGRGEQQRSGDVFAIGLQHAYIALVYDVSVLDVSERLVAIAMELVVGQPLAKHVLKEKRRRQRERQTRRMHCSHRGLSRG